MTINKHLDIIEEIKQITSQKRFGAYYFKESDYLCGDRIFGYEKNILYKLTPENNIKMSFIYKESIESLEAVLKALRGEKYINVLSISMNVDKIPGMGEILASERV